MSYFVVGSLLKLSASSGQVQNALEPELSQAGSGVAGVEGEGLATVRRNRVLALEMQEGGGRPWGQAERGREEDAKCLHTNQQAIPA